MYFYKCIFFKIIKFDWSLFYGMEMPTSTLALMKQLSFRINAKDSFLVSHCVFDNTCAECGGAMLISSENNNVKTLVEDTSFLKCYSTGLAQNSGGAILYADKGQFVIHRSCGYMCHTKAQANSITCGQFIHSTVSEGTNFMNVMKLSS